MSFLDGFLPAFRNKLQKLGTERSLAEGEVLVRRGELGGDLFLVIEGVLEARDGEEVLSVSPAGRLLGEIAFMDGGARSADLVARGPTRVLCWDRKPLQQLLRSDPSQHVAFLTVIAAKQTGLVRRLVDGAPSADSAPVLLERGRFLPGQHEITVPGGEAIRLSPIESRLLAYLVVRPGKIVSHRSLLDEVWGYASGVSSRTVFATVHRLRAKIELDPKMPRHVVAVAGAGYRFDP